MNGSWSNSNNPRTWSIHEANDLLHTQQWLELIDATNNNRKTCFMGLIPQSHTAQILDTQGKNQRKLRKRTVLN